MAEVGKTDANYRPQQRSQEAFVPPHVNVISCHDGAIIYYCKKCNATIKGKAQVKFHVTCGERHESAFECNSCSSKFLTEVELQLHQRTHKVGRHPNSGTYRSKSSTRPKANSIEEEEKPLICGHCGRCFKTIEYLRVHVQSHNAEPFFQCEFCSRGFTREKNLSHHVKSRHCKNPQGFQTNASFRDEEEKPFNGKKEGESSTRTDNTARTVVSPKVEGPFVCQHCSRVFSRLAHLNNHLRSHKEKTNFECEECGKRFVSKVTLDLHARTHALLLHCNLCGIAFDREDNLQTHICVMHPVSVNLTRLTYPDVKPISISTPLAKNTDAEALNVTMETSGAARRSTPRNTRTGPIPPQNLRANGGVKLSDQDTVLKILQFIFKKEPTDPTPSSQRQAKDENANSLWAQNRAGTSASCSILQGKPCCGQSPPITKERPSGISPDQITLKSVSADNPVKFNGRVQQLNLGAPKLPNEDAIRQILTGIFRPNSTSSVQTVNNLQQTNNSNVMPTLRSMQSTTAPEEKNLASNLRIKECCVVMPILKIVEDTRKIEPKKLVPPINLAPVNCIDKDPLGKSTIQENSQQIALQDRINDVSHAKSHVLSVGKSVYTCTVCTKTFSWFSSFKKHTFLEHARRPRFPCKRCGKRFRRRCNLDLHGWSHSGNRTLFWDQGFKDFPTSRNIAQQQEALSAKMLVIKERILKAERLAYSKQGIKTLPKLRITVRSKSDEVLHENRLSHADFQDQDVSSPISSPAALGSGLTKGDQEKEYQRRMPKIELILRKDKGGLWTASKRNQQNTEIYPEKDATSIGLDQISKQNSDASLTQALEKSLPSTSTENKCPISPPKDIQEIRPLSSNTGYLATKLADKANKVMSDKDIKENQALTNARPNLTEITPNRVPCLEMNETNVPFPDQISTTAEDLAPTAPNTFEETSSKVQEAETTAIASGIDPLAHPIVSPVECDGRREINVGQKADSSDLSNYHCETLGEMGTQGVDKFDQSEILTADDRKDTESAVGNIPEEDDITSPVLSNDILRNEQDPFMGALLSNSQGAVGMDEKPSTEEIIAEGKEDPIRNSLAADVEQDGPEKLAPVDFKDEDSHSNDSCSLVIDEGGDEPETPHANNLSSLNPFSPSESIPHGRSSHKTGLGTKKIVCTKCGRRFANRALWGSHLSTHVRKARHSCKYCGKRFFWLRNLATHNMFAHPDMPPYKCEHCDRRFFMEFSLECHTQKHLTNGGPVVVQRDTGKSVEESGGPIYTNQDVGHKNCTAFNATNSEQHMGYALQIRENLDRKGNKVWDKQKNVLCTSIQENKPFRANVVQSDDQKINFEGTQICSECENTDPECVHCNFAGDSGKKLEDFENPLEPIGVEKCSGPEMAVISLDQNANSGEKFVTWNQSDISVTIQVNKTDNSNKIFFASEDKNKKEDAEDVVHDPEFEKIFQEMHAIECGKPLHICTTCVPKKKSLENHLSLTQTEGKGFSSKKCGPNFSNKLPLGSHISNHNPKRPYGCKHCRKRFSWLTNLRTHTAFVHSEKQPFLCEICDRSFPLKFSRDVHARTHLQTMVSPLKTNPVKFGSSEIIMPERNEPPRVPVNRGITSLDIVTSDAGHIIATDTKNPCQDMHDRRGAENVKRDARSSCIPAKKPCLSETSNSQLGESLEVASVCPECHTKYGGIGSKNRAVQDACGHFKCRKCLIESSSANIDCIQCVCPECHVKYGDSASKNRAVQDSCGHFKCRKCLIESTSRNVDCNQCPRSAGADAGINCKVGVQIGNQNSESSLKGSTVPANRTDTPVKKRSKPAHPQNCKFCGKEYKTAGYLQRHLDLRHRAEYPFPNSVKITPENIRQPKEFLRQNFAGAFSSLFGPSGGKPPDPVVVSKNYGIPGVMVQHSAPKNTDETDVFFQQNPVCPECNSNWGQGTKSRPDQDICGHYKCKKCFISGSIHDFDSCSQCARAVTGKRSVRAQNVSWQYGPTSITPMPREINPPMPIAPLNWAFASVRRKY